MRNVARQEGDACGQLQLHWCSHSVCFGAMAQDNRQNSWCFRNRHLMMVTAFRLNVRCQPVHHSRCYTVTFKSCLVMWLIADCRSLMLSRGGLLGINCIQSDMSLLAGSTFTCHITPAGGLETYCPQDSVIMQEGLYCSGLSCIALMSQYVHCNSVPDESILARCHSLLWSPKICPAFTQ